MHLHSVHEITYINQLNVGTLIKCYMKARFINFFLILEEHKIHT